MNLEDCLPSNLRGPSTVITRVGAGLSGAGVHRVETSGQVYILKISNTPSEDWRRTLAIQRSAADAGLAPSIVHVDEMQRAVVTAFVADRSFFALWATPTTRDAALALLGRTLRRVHDLPLPDAPAVDPRGLLATLWAELAGLELPAFVGAAVHRVLDEPVPATDRPTVLSHNDVNPTNLVYDGERLLLFDWESAAPNEPFYDLAAISVFLRMDEATCQQLIAAHDDAPAAPLPARFAYDRRLVAAFCGAAFLRLARAGGHRGTTEGTVASTLSLAEVYQQARSGQLAVGTSDGQWLFGLALLKASSEL